MNATDSEILIGTSGYDYPEWKGAFYPADLKRADFLAYYATQFNAVELNSTFYNMPTAERLQSLYERSGGRLKFSVKANRLLTHEISASWNDAAKEFILALDPFFEKGNLCAVLFQFPQSFHYTDENRIYLAKLIAAFKGYPVMIEFRHSEWLRESVFCGLEERGTGLVYCDMPQLKYLPDGKTEGTPFVGPNAYIRLHGRNADTWYSCADSPNGSARYAYDYSDEELGEFVPVVAKAVDEGRRVQAFFNNHPNGSGARNAKKFAELVRKII